jgi:DNA polymerase (family 10)
MELKQAQAIAKTVVEKLKPYCERIETAGSIRRLKTINIHDIDIVCIPSNQGKFITACQGIGKLSTKGALQLILPASLLCATVDLYMATPTTWATLLLIRTGSKESNIRLCSLARQQRKILHADGSGLFQIVYEANGMDVQHNHEERIAGDTEESIFAALGIKYLPPEQRG